jgi:hypothetical protein
MTRSEAFAEGLEVRPEITCAVPHGPPNADPRLSAAGASNLRTHDGLRLDMAEQSQDVILHEADLSFVLG